MKIVVCLAALLMSGCFRAQARTTPEAPPLDVPLPPPRVVETVEPNPPPPVGLVEGPARSTPARPRPATPPRPDSSKAEPPKVETVPPDAGRTPEDPRPSSSPTLQTIPAEREAEVEKEIRTLLSRATNNLSRIDYGRLNGDAQEQYDLAKRYVSQAEEALRAKNLPFSANLADKADTLAAQLAGR